MVVGAADMGTFLCISSQSKGTLSQECNIGISGEKAFVISCSASSACFLPARQGRNPAWQSPPQAHDNALMMGFLENKIFILYFTICTSIVVRDIEMCSWKNCSEVKRGKTRQRGSGRQALRTTDTLGSWEEGMTRVNGLNPHPARKSL